jgi:hypothetical protein
MSDHVHRWEKCVCGEFRNLADHPTRSPDSPDHPTDHEPRPVRPPVATNAFCARCGYFPLPLEGAHPIPWDWPKLDPPRSPDSVRTPDLDVERLREAMRRHAEREGMHACSHYVEGYNCPPEIAAEYAALHPASPPQEGEK